ncbi:MAG: hypothetical protein WC332_02785 [Clostridia bacterium]|jgi:hypothetical protein
MKQMITLEQWGEIGEKEKEIFQEKLKRTIHGRYQGAESHFNSDDFPVIGHMIEFLGDDLIAIGNHKIEKGYFFISCKGIVKNKLYAGKEKTKTEVYKQAELCDALWEAVKYKLTNSK